MNDSAYEEEEEEEEEEEGDDDDEGAQAEGNKETSQQGVTSVPCIYNKLTQSLKSNWYDLIALSF